MSDRSNGQRDAEEASSEATRPNKPIELPLAMLPQTHPCAKCGDCCRYLAIEIDAPTTNKDYDHIFWYLTHRGVAIYVDWEGDWYIEFQTVCEHLSDDATCGIYRDRPEICSDFSWNECERATGESASKLHFHTPSDFFAWMEEKRPRAFKRFQNYRTKLIAKREETAGATPPPRSEASASSPPREDAPPPAPARSRA